MSSALREPPTNGQPTDVLIRASAGTGKTFQLSNRYLERLFDGVPVDRILATTFTRKAAGEILDRILLRLAEAVADETQRLGLERDLARPLPPKLCRDTLRDLVRQLHRVRVQTLDGFFQQIAKSQTLELELPPGWEIVDDRRSARIVGRAIEAVLHDEATDEVVRMMHLLHEGHAKRAVAESVREVVERFHGLFRESDPAAWHRLKPSRRFSEEELADLVEELAALEMPTHKTWQREHGNDVAAAAAADWQRFIDKGLGSKVLAGDSTYCRKPIEPDVRAVYERLTEVPQALLLERMRLQAETTYELLVKYDAVFERIARAERALRFQDVTRQLAVGLARLDAGRLAYRLDGHVDHLLLDEFQDTSLDQWAVVRAFAARVAGDDPGRSLFTVGDVKQAIYGWRGGKSEIFDALEAEFPNVASRPLDTSYRSSQPVIDAVNAVFPHLAEHPALDDLTDAIRDWSRDFSLHTTARTEFAGYVTLVVAAAPDDDETALDTAIDTAIDTAVRTVAEIIERAPGRSVGVLVRRNEIVGRIAFELRKRGIEASEENGNPLVDSAAVGLVLSLLRLADHPGGRAPRFHVATSPIAGTLGFTDFTDDGAATRLAGSIRRALVEEGYGPVVLGWARRLAPFCDERDANRLRQLVRLAFDYETTATLRPRDFVDFLTEKKVAAPSGHDVRVMTFHGSKGLQFDAVVLPELDFPLFKGNRDPVVGRPTATAPPERICLYLDTKSQKALPGPWRKAFDENVATRTRESLCLLYVAVTRAVHELRMIVQPRTPDKKTGKTSYGKSPAGLLRATLGGGREVSGGETLYEAGHPNWAGASPATETPAVPATSPRLTITLAEMPGGRTRGLERVAPSGLEGSRTVTLHDHLASGGSEARERGTLIHAWFEQIEWLDDGPPDDAELRRIAAEIPIPPEVVDDGLDRFRAMLGQPAVVGILTRTTYQPPIDLALSDDVQRDLAAGPLRLEVQNERGFAVRRGSTLVSGSIDRLVLMYRGETLVAADVVDFKTDDLADSDEEAIAAKVAYYRGQLEAYRPAVAAMYGLDVDRVSARLAFLSIGRIENV